MINSSLLNHLLFNSINLSAMVTPHPAWPSKFVYSLKKEPPCHGTTSLPLLRPPLTASKPFCLCSAPSTSTLLQLQSMLVQLMQLHHTHSQTNCRSTPDPFRPGSHAKGHHLYTLSTFVLFA